MALTAFELVAVGAAIEGIVAGITGEDVSTITALDAVITAVSHEQVTATIT